MAPWGVKLDHPNSALRTHGARQQGASAGGWTKQLQRQAATRSRSACRSSTSTFRPRLRVASHLRPVPRQLRRAASSRWRSAAIPPLGAPSALSPGCVMWLQPLPLSLFPRVLSLSLSLSLCLSCVGGGRITKTAPRAAGQALAVSRSKVKEVHRHESRTLGLGRRVPARACLRRCVASARVSPAAGLSRLRVCTAVRILRTSTQDWVNHGCMDCGVCTTRDVVSNCRGQKKGE